MRELCRECSKDRLKTLVKRQDKNINKVAWYAMSRTQLTDWLVEHAPATVFDVYPNPAKLPCGHWLVEHAPATVFDGKARRAPQVVAKLPCAEASESGPGLAYFSWIRQVFQPMQGVTDADFWYFVPGKQKRRWNKKAKTDSGCRCAAAAAAAVARSPTDI